MSWAGSSARDLWGRGYAGEISRTLLDYAFDVLGLRQVVGETIDLRRAGRLLGQLGMAKLGETQVTDCRGRPAALYQYAVTAEQWRERKRLLAFFDAENRRDWGLYQTFLHPEVVWELRQPDGWGSRSEASRPIWAGSKRPMRAGTDNSGASGSSGTQDRLPPGWSATGASGPGSGSNFKTA